MGRPGKQELELGVRHGKQEFELGVRPGKEAFDLEVRSEKLEFDLGVRPGRPSQLTLGAPGGDNTTVHNIEKLKQSFKGTPRRSTWRQLKSKNM